MLKKYVEKLIEKNGIERQSIVAMEECSELQKAISKALRYEQGDRFVADNQREDLIEEIADVIFCIEQLKVMYSIDEEEIEKVKKEKEERTLKRNGII